MESLIIPSAIQRIRSFLIEMCGMKVKPWASTEETLAALHTTLVARGGCAIFWASLRGLLEALARDLKMRQEASPGTLVDNELLDSERYGTLLDEIRAALASQSTQPASFRRLAAALSAPALGLLLFLGGAASVGCSNAGLHQAQDAGAPGIVDASVAQPDAATSIADAPRTPNAVDAKVAQPEANLDLPRITLPDARPATDAVAPRQSDGATVTIQDIMDSCNIPDQQQAQVLDCLGRLGESWTTGVASVLAGSDCNYVATQLNCFTYSQSCLLGAPDFDPNTTPICKPMPVYIGVRFV